MKASGQGAMPNAQYTPYTKTMKNYKYFSNFENKYFVNSQK
jgi:hypothetical protein